jgi:hypothetical protein
MRGAFAAGLAATTVLLIEPAAAQTAPPPECVSFTPAPALPDGATASNTAMRQAREALEAWRGVRAAELAACTAASQQLEVQARAGAAAHNTAASEVDALIERFAAENDEYNQRRSARRDSN